ncbi:MAG: GFA family protein [bacterium]
MNGQCHCGELKYQATGAVVKCSHCECRGCQLASGTLTVPFITFKRDDFKVVAGELASVRGRTNDGCDKYGVWYFCPKCGTQIFWLGDSGDEVDIFAGTLDDTSEYKITA